MQNNNYYKGVFHEDVWIQVDFLSDKQVDGVVTQGRHNVGQWVKEYKVEYMEDGSDSFKTVLDENGQPLVRKISYNGITKF